MGIQGFTNTYVYGIDYVEWAIVLSMAHHLTNLYVVVTLHAYKTIYHCNPSTHNCSYVSQVMNKIELQNHPFLIGD